MILFKFLIPIYGLLLLFNNTINAQAQLRESDCYELAAKLDLHEPTKNSKFALRKKAIKQHRCVLEKRIQKGIWKKIKTDNKPHQQVTFKNVEQGMYRVTFIALAPSNSKSLFNYNSSSRIDNTPLNNANTFISNEIYVSGKSCNETKGSSPSFTIYPNPSSGNFYIDTDHTDSEYIITDTKGVVLTSGILDKTRTSINMNHSIDEGVYLIYINSSHGSKSVFKLVIIN